MDSSTLARVFTPTQSKSTTETEIEAGSSGVAGQLSSFDLCIVLIDFGAMLFFSCCI